MKDETLNDADLDTDANDERRYVVDAVSRRPPAAGFERRLAQARSGIDDGVAVLVEHCRNYVWLLARRELGPTLLAKVAPSDIVQDAYLEAQKKFHQFRGTTEAEFVVWLCRIVMSKVSHARRRYQGTQARNPLVEIPLVDGDGDLQEVIVALSARTPGSLAAGNELAALVQEALARLPDDYRVVVELRNWQRQTFAQIGTRLGRSEEAVRKVWSRAIDRLAKELEGADGDSRPHG